mmetsp:Transcript_33591/g.79211  ORF Transcript_33591/g.79211 Transcript_33591/m.79211 type:complete len:80 (-) Transcript_33591:411-650(-)
MVTALFGETTFYTSHHKPKESRVYKMKFVGSKCKISSSMRVIKLWYKRGKHCTNLPGDTQSRLVVVKKEFFICLECSLL